MRRLWNYIPPRMSDILGFEAVINQTQGMGIADDCTRYRPIGVGRVKSAGGSWLSWPDINDESFDWDIDWDDNGAEPVDQIERPLSKGVRLAASNLRNQDIIYGTSKKVRGAFERHASCLAGSCTDCQHGDCMNNTRASLPDFLLLCHAPSSTMISSDLDFEAEYFTQTYGIPCACVEIDGSRDYLYGISQTLLTMGKLLLKPFPENERIPGSINILGCSRIEWKEKQLEDVEGMAHFLKLHVLSRWGMKESTENLKMAPKAALNWVVNVAGLRLARYMYEEFGIPYVCGAPFGEEYTDRILGLIDNFFGNTGGGSETVAAGSETYPEDGCIAVPKLIGLPSRANVLIIGEQFQAEALRRILVSRGAKGAVTASFGEMDKALMQAGDTRLTSEDDLVKLVNEGHFTTFVGDPDIKTLVKSSIGDHSEFRWINIPNGGSYSPATVIDPVNMAGPEMDQWLNVEMAKAGFQPKNVRFRLS